MSLLNSTFLFAEGRVSYQGFLLSFGFCFTCCSVYILRFFGCRDPLFATDDNAEDGYRELFTTVHCVLYRAIVTQGTLWVRCNSRLF